jgi:hypothetical protein
MAVLGNGRPVPQQPEQNNSKTPKISYFQPTELRSRLVELEESQLNNSWARKFESTKTRRNETQEKCRVAEMPDDGLALAKD